MMVTWDQPSNIKGREQTQNSRQAVMENFLPEGGGAGGVTGEGSWGEGPTAQPAIARTRELGPRGQKGLRQRSRTNQQGRPQLKEP